MNKFEGILFCTDLDGTLIDSDHRVSAENRDAIAYFQSEGGLFTFVTGRPPVIAGDIWQLVRPNAPFGCFNGAGIYDQQKGEYRWSTPLPAAAMELAAFVDEQLPDVGFQLNCAHDIYFCKENEAMEQFRRVTGYPHNVRHYNDVDEPSYKVVFGHTDDGRITDLAAALNSHPLASQVGFIRSELTLYEILPKGVSKGTVLEKMAQLLNIDPARTIAVGDYDNDVSMLRQAGVGYAVANACPAAKAAADRMTVDNDHHAIAAIVEALDRGEVPLCCRI